MSKKTDAEFDEIHALNELFKTLSSQDQVEAHALGGVFDIDIGRLRSQGRDDEIGVSMRMATAQGVKALMAKKARADRFFRPLYETKEREWLVNRAAYDAVELHDTKNDLKDIRAKLQMMKDAAILIGILLSFVVAMRLWV